MFVRKPGEGNTFLKGLAHPLVAKIGEVGLSEASGAGDKTGEVQEHLETSSKCKGKDQEPGNGCDNAGNGHAMQSSEENVVVPKEINLSGVLDSIMSLDPKGDFMGPTDGYPAPNHSKVIEASMCFAMMQEKIRTQQYSTWRMFVEDFEWICHNALRCNQKRSIIWAAANDLLRRGKKRLEQYERWGESLIALNKTGGSHAKFDPKLGLPTKRKSENVEARVSQPSNSPIVKGPKMAIPSNTTGPAESKPPASGAASIGKNALIKNDTSSIQQAKEEKQDDQKPNSVAPFLAPVLDIVSEEISAQKDAADANVSREVRSADSRHRVLDNSPSAVGGDEFVDVEEDRDDESDDYRAEFDGEATESSSSYDSAGSALEGEVGFDRMQSMFEADSEFRDGNGAGGLVEDEDGLLATERGTKALDPGWKQHRRGIEWRCRWLELRTKAINAKLSLYEKSLKSLQNSKIWKWEGEVGDGTSARTVPVKILRNHPVIHRKHRRRPEDAEGDLDLGRHPVFSRYEKRKSQRKSDDGLAQEKVDSQQAQQSESETESIFEKVDAKQQPVADSAVVEEDSLELLLWQIEALQARVNKLQHTVKKGAGPRKTSTQGVPRSGTPSSSTASMGRTGSGSARRKSSDYDINNVVMPVNLGSSTVQEIRHLNIETPGWRLVEDIAASSGGAQGIAGEESSSEEEIEDEHYERRHARMEALEQQQRNMLPQKRTVGETRPVGKGKVGIGKTAAMMAGEGSSSLALPSGPSPSDPFSRENVPKRQRSNRNTVVRQALLPAVPPAAQAIPSPPQASPSSTQASPSPAQGVPSPAQGVPSQTKTSEDAAAGSGEENVDVGPSGVGGGENPTTESMEES